MINSAQNPRLKLARSLMGRPKERQAARAFVAEGVRLVEEALSSGWPVRYVLYTAELRARGRALVKQLEGKGVEVEQVSDVLLNAISETENSQGLLAVLEYSALPIPPSPDFVLIPDSIRDPGNLGSLLRTAAAAGVQAVWLPPETSDAFAPKVLRAGMGILIDIAANWRAAAVAPSASPPTINASGWRKSVCQQGLPCMSAR
jgi:RNA methyltransferase, TrmH family